MNNSQLHALSLLLLSDTPCLSDYSLWAVKTHFSVDWKQLYFRNNGSIHLKTQPCNPDSSTRTIGIWTITTTTIQVQISHT